MWQHSSNNLIQNGTKSKCQLVLVGVETRIQLASRGKRGVRLGPHLCCEDSRAFNDYSEVGFVLAFGAAADFASLKRQEHFAFTHSGLAVDVDTP